MSLAASLVAPFLEFLLDDALDFKEAVHLAGVEHSGQAVDILHADALGALLHFHLALGHCGSIAAGTARVYRGGSWYFDEWFSRISFRNSVSPGYRSYGIGLRLAM